MPNLRNRELDQKSLRTCLLLCIGYFSIRRWIQNRIQCGYFPIISVYTPTTTSTCGPLKGLDRKEGGLHKKMDCPLKEEKGNWSPWPRTRDLWFQFGKIYSLRSHKSVAHTTTKLCITSSFPPTLNTDWRKYDNPFALDMYILFVFIMFLSFSTLWAPA